MKPSFPEPRLDDIFKAIFSLPANTRKGYTSALLNLCSRPRIIEEIFLMVIDISYLVTILTS